MPECGEPYHPVNDEKNGALHTGYKVLSDAEKRTVFGGRLITTWIRPS